MKSKLVRRDEAPVDSTPWGTIQWLFGENSPELEMTDGAIMPNDHHRHISFE